jgi:hypothetical protein
VNIILTQKELEDITGRRTPSAQARVLNGMRISYERNALGKIIISRSHFERVMGGVTESAGNDKPAVLNLAAL